MCAQRNKFRYLLPAIVALVFGLTLSAQALPGDLDLTFDIDGKVTLPVGVSTNDLANAVAIQTDGKIVVGGTSSSNFTLVRFNVDGSLDTTFGTGGIVVTPVGSVGSTLRSVAIQADGKIVAAGSSFDGSHDIFAVARYLTNGSVDTSFDTDGIVTTAIGSVADLALDVVVQPNDFIITAGYTVTGSGDVDFALIRYKPDGSLDGSFGTSGIVITSIGSISDVANGVALQPDGKIVAAGYTTVANTDFAVVRYDSNGLLDISFGTGGIATTSVGSGGGAARAVVIQTDGFIVTAGYSFDGSNFDFALVRYKPDGNLDPLFDGDGIVITPVGSGGENANAAAIQPDGKIVVGGWSFNGAGGNDFALVRYNSNGALDSGFGAGGKVLTPFGTQGDIGNAIAIQTDGKIVLAGYTDNGTGENDFAVARYFGAPTSGNLYVINDSTTGNQIYGFSVNETTGSLTPLIGFPIATGGMGSGATTSEQIVIDRINNRLFAINDGSNTVSAYSINPTTGALTALTFSPLALGAGNWNTIAVHPTGSPLIIGDGDATPVVKSYSITSTTATEAVGSPYPTGTLANPFSSVFSKTGNFYYAGGEGNPSFAGFSVATASGVLTALAGSPFNSGSNAPAGYATDRNGRFFSVDFAGDLRAFTTMAGVPSAVAGNPFASGLTEPVDGVLHPNEQFYFVANRAFGTSSVGSFQIAGAGSSTTLTAVAGSPFASGGNATSALTINRMGSFLFASNLFSRNLTSYSVNSTNGVLTNIGVQPVDTIGTAGIVTGIAYYMPPIAPTSASVSVGGRVTDSTGRSISRALVTLSDFNGGSRTALTNVFGYYRFDEVRVGQTYIFLIRHKKYQFSPITVTINDEVIDLNFRAEGLAESLTHKKEKDNEK